MPGKFWKIFYLWWIRIEFDLSKIFWDNIFQFKSCLKMSSKIFLNEVFFWHFNAPRYNWIKIRHFFNACRYIRGKYKEPVAFVSIKALWFWSKKQSLWNYCTQNWHICHFSPSLYEKRHLAVKFNGTACSEKLNITVDFSVLVVYIVLTWIRAYICFSIT